MVSSHDPRLRAKAGQLAATWEQYETPLIRSLRPQCNREGRLGAHSGALLKEKSPQLPEADEATQKALRFAIVKIAKVTGWKLCKVRQNLEKFVRWKSRKIAKKGR
jgi:hypothetical protein